MGKESFFSKIGNTLDGALDTVKEKAGGAIDEVKEKFETEEGYMTETFDTMAELCDTLNEMRKSDDVKEFKLVACVPYASVESGQVRAIIFVKK